MNEKYLKTKEGSIEDTVKLMQNKVLESDYQDKFKKALDKEGKPLGHMTGAEKKAFFGKVDKMHTAKNEVKEEDAYDGTPAEVKKLKAKEKADAEKAKAKSKKEEVNETHTTQTAKANRHQKSAGGEKSPISHMVNKSIEEITSNGTKTFAQMRAEMDEACWDSHKQVGTKQKGGKTVPNCVPKNEAAEKTDAERTFPGKDEKIKGENPADKGKKEQETGEDTRDPNKKTMSGKVATSPEMNPKVDYKY